MRNLNTFFSENPVSLDISRSKFKRPFNNKFTCNAGDLIPFYVDEVLPGDTHSIDTAALVRMTTLIAPIMDNIYMDVYYFYTPSRLVWNHFKNFMGESDRAWMPSVSYSVPQILCCSGSGATRPVTVGSICDYMGVPIGISGTANDPFSFSALPVRCYTKIVNDWFRDENLTNPLLESFGDTNVLFKDNDTIYGGTPFKVAKLGDYFTHALPAPQRGPDVPLPLGQSANVQAPNGVLLTGLNSGEVGRLQASTGALNTPLNAYNADTTNPFTAGEWFGIQPGSLYVDLTSATGTSINQLRMAFQVQKMYEKEARGGSRYIELLKVHFGVNSPDQRLQRPEYLGGTRIPINIHQVVQNSATDSVSPQGHTTAYSLTVNTHFDFTKSFVEHGYIIGLCCIRYPHTYQQGLERFWSRKDKEDYYFPVLANIGEQAVLNKEIYATGTSTDDEVFGYQEAWADYRYKPSRVSGYMRSGISGSLDLWHLADYYTSQPFLSDSWIRENEKNIDRGLAVSSTNAHQFLCDIHVENNCVRPMPLYSIPGLIDHH